MRSCQAGFVVPDLIPIMLLARLAVDTSLQRQGIGHALLRDTIYNTPNRLLTLLGYVAFWFMPLMSVPDTFIRAAALQPHPLMN